MSTQGIKLKAIADAIREKDGTTGPIPANIFAERILALPAGIESPGIVLPAASTQEEHFTRIAAAIRAKEGTTASIPANEFARRVMALENVAPKLQWVEAKLPSSQYWSCVTYANDRFISISTSRNDVIYSLDGVNWAENSTKMPDSITWDNLVFDGDQTLVAFGGGANYSYVNYSNDKGLNWKRAPLLASVNIFGAAYGDGRFLALPHNGTLVLTSTNGGVTWSVIARLSLAKYWTALTYGNGKFVGVSGRDSSVAIYSENGTSFYYKALPASAYWVDVAYGNGKFVAISGNSSNVGAYSLDGSTWVAMTMPAKTYWKSITYGNGKFVAIAGGTNALTISAYSEDGINWELVELPQNKRWADVAYGNGKFVAVSGLTSSTSDVAAYLTA